MGPSTVPWGTPDKTEVQDEWCPHRTMHWYRLVRKLLSQDRSGPWIPYACIFVKRRSFGTESNAFERSKNISSVVKPLFLSLAQSWKDDNNWERQDFPFRKPNCSGITTSFVIQNWTSCCLNEWGWVSYEELWRPRGVLSVNDCYLILDSSLTVI